MIRFILIGLGGGLLFGIVDGLIGANPMGRRMAQPYGPIARESIRIVTGIVIDLFYGLAMAGVFILLYESLPGDGGILKGLGYALGIWFFRVVMYVVSHWMTFRIPTSSLVYTLVTGAMEMALLGVLYGLTLTPF